MIKKAINSYFPNNFDIRGIRSNLKQKKKISRWVENGKPNPPPHLIKQQTILKWQKLAKYSCFIETGTFRGDMIYAMLPHFDKIYSIELYEPLYKFCQHRYKHNRKVEIIHGDSGDKIKFIISKLNSPSVFWLDGHYSGETTGKGATETPVMEELNNIYQSPIGEDSIVIIDDVHCFGKGDYPTIEAIEKLINSTSPNSEIQIEYNCIQIAPKKLTMNCI